MSIHNQWLFEAPSTQASSHHANPEYEILLENEWEIPSGNYENFPLAEEEWEARPTQRPVTSRPASRARRPVARSPRPAKRSATRGPQRRPTAARRQPQRAPLAQRQLRQPAPSPPGSGAAEPKILIAIIDRFEFGSYLLKRHQFERISDLRLILEANKDLFPQLQLTFRGHTDNAGGETPGNWFLAGRRAIEVESFIKRMFKKDYPDLVTFFTGGGSREPVAPNTTQDGRARNRRVEVFSNIPLKPAK